MSSSQSSPSVGVASPPSPVDSTLVEEEELGDCPICLEKMMVAPSDGRHDYRYLGSTSCGHKYHYDCWHGWYSLRPYDISMCPSCDESIPRCCLCNQHVSCFTTIAAPPSSSSSVSLSPSSSSSSPPPPDGQGIHDVQTASTMDQDDDDDDEENVEMPIETLVRESLWSNDFEVVEEAMQELYGRVMRDDDKLKYLVGLGTHAVVIQVMERFKAELVAPTGLSLVSGCLCFMFVLYRLHRDDDFNIDPILVAPGLLSMVKLMQAHSDNLDIVKTGMDAMLFVFGASEALFDNAPNGKAIIKYMVGPMIHHGVITLTLESMKKFMELAETQSSKRTSTTLMMNLYIFLLYGGPGTIVALAREIGVPDVKDTSSDDDDNNNNNENDKKTCCDGFMVVLSTMKMFPEVNMIQNYGCQVVMLCAYAGKTEYHLRLRQLEVIDVISSAASFPDEEVREAATYAMEAFEEYSFDV